MQHRKITYPFQGAPCYMFAFFVFLFLGLTTYSTTSFAFLSAAEKNGVVIYAYHRIDEPEYPSTNIQYDQFEAHINQLMDGGFNVISLNDAVDAFISGGDIPEKAIVITFEGGHESIMKSAVPLLLKNKLPFTVFVSVDQADWQSNQYLDWDQLNDLSDSGLATIGIHPATYGRMLDYDIAEAETQINRAKSRYRKEMGVEAEYFSYPFGEFSLEIKNLMKKYGIKAAFGQQSGVAYAGSDIYNIPRFAMTENYAGIDRFQLTSNALPLPLSDVSPEDPLLAENPPHIGFTLDKSIKNTANLACFATTEGQTKLEFIGDRVEIRLTEPLSQGRARVNCTMPVGYTDEGQQQWRWFGLLFTLPNDAYLNNDEDSAIITETINDNEDTAAVGE